MPSNYKLIYGTFSSSNGLDGFNEKINNHIKDGYLPLGPPCIEPATEDSCTYIYQAMVTKDLIK